jgi:hypothetical protein
MSASSRRLRIATTLATVVAIVASDPVANGAEELHPTLFGEGVFSTGAYDFFVALTPDQRTAYLCRASADFGYWTILETHRRGGQWATPTMAPFSGRWSDADPHLTPDGSKLFFISNRPESGSAAKESCDLWMVERSGEGWGNARPLDSHVCTDATEWPPLVAANGNLYFGTSREGGKGRGSPDGKTFYFTSARSRFRPPPAKPMSYEDLTRRLQSPGNGLGDIYSIPIEALELPH